MALEALQRADTVQAIAARHEIHPNQVSVRKRQAVESVGAAFAGGPERASTDETRLKDAYAKIGKLTLERDFFRSGLAG